LKFIARARGEEPPASHAEAAAWRDRLRSEIRTGAFIEPDAAAKTLSRDSACVTFGDVCDEYLKRHVRVSTRRARGRREMEILVAVLRRAEIPAALGTIRLERKEIRAVTRADVEAVRAWRRLQQASGRSHSGSKGGEVGTNRLLSRLRHIFNWAIAEEYLEATPFKRGPVTIVKLDARVEGSRTRRLEPSVSLPDGTVADGEEARLLKHSGPHLRALIVAALSTGCRLGELLSLQWSQVRVDEQGQPRWLFLPATKTKSAQARAVPIGATLRAELAMRTTGPDGQVHPSTAFVFGNDCGERVVSIRTAWTLACRRAGIRDLHFHDLRREFASRLLESSAGLHDVQLFLGHANVTQTSTYLSSTPVRLEKALARMESAAGLTQKWHKPQKKAPRPASKRRPQTPVNH
jgi:integrase